MDTGEKWSWVDRDRARSLGRFLKGRTLGSVIEDEFFFLFSFWEKGAVITGGG